MLGIASACTALLAAAQTVSAATGYIHSPVKRGMSKSLAARWTSTNPQVTVDGSVCTVMPLGGGRDDGPALLYAMNQLCTSNALIVLPGYYTVNTVLVTKMTNVEVRLQGAISYTPNIPYWNATATYLTYQNSTTFWFFEGHGVTFHGGGTIEGNGPVWWEFFARNNLKGTAGASSPLSFLRPIPLTIGNSTNVVVKDLSMIDAPNWHNFVYQSTDVHYSNMQLRSISYNTSAPAQNTDGWDIYRSSYVTIEDSNIQNGDDCVSFKPNTTFVTVQNLVCNGSHGISVGSLGQYYGEVDIISDIYVKNIQMYNAQNGARIKAFGGSNNTQSSSGGGTGYVKNITFENFYNQNVDNPIYLTQCYSGSTEQCTGFPSTIAISDVHYINVTGTASGLVANSTVASLECSAICQNITAVETNLIPKNGTAKYLCANLANESLLDFKCTDVIISKG